MPYSSMDAQVFFIVVGLWVTLVREVLNG